MSPYKLIFGKACHLLVELEHEENRALQKLNFDMKACGERRMLQLNQFDEFRLKAIHKCLLYKVQTELWHNKFILPWSFEKGHWVLQFQTQAISRCLKSSRASQYEHVLLNF